MIPIIIPITQIRDNSSLLILINTDIDFCICGKNKQNPKKPITIPVI